MDSYKQFLDYFDISKNELFNWGINNTIFPKKELVDIYWENLKRRIINGDKVYIRGYGRDAHGTELYQGLYEYIFGNSNITKDPTNNAIPHKSIEALTQIRRNKDIYNYQVSHIFGRTKNVFLFEAPWNICYTPKILDPFTGHETKGEWPIEYQKIFLRKAVSLYQKYIEEYNALLVEYDMADGMKSYINKISVTQEEKVVKQFKKDCEKELAPIEI